MPGSVVGYGVHHGYFLDNGVPPVDFIAINLYVILIMELLTTRQFTLSHGTGSNREDEAVTGDIRYIDDGRPKPLMVIAHGYKTFKDWGMFPHIGEYFAQRGFVTIVINFARNGVKVGESEIRDWEAFARLTPTSEVDDLHLILDAVDEGALEYYGIDTDGTHRVLLGHSCGGSVSIITASERRDVDAVIAWSAPATFDRFPDEEKKMWRQNGKLALPEDPEYGIICIGLEPLDDIENNRERLDVIDAVRRLKCPVFIAQGDEDPTVMREEADALYAMASDKKSGIYQVKSPDHLYGVSHPYESGSSAHLEQMLDETNRWLGNVFSNNE